jgi:arsenate reductase
MSARRRVLFVCTHNSARSQMAEAFLRKLAGDRFDVASAGTEARGVHPMAIQAMAEDGIDISLQRSKTVDRFLDQRFDLVITVCDDAAEACPVFPNAAERRHWSFPDPSAVLGDVEQRFAAFASVRDAIRDRIERELIAEDVITGAR